MKHTETTGKALQEHQEANLSEVAPLIIQDHYEIDYRHSYAQDSPFFVGLSQGRLLGSRCTGCQYMYATPTVTLHGMRGDHDMGSASANRTHSYLHGLLLRRGELSERNPLSFGVGGI